MGLRVPTIPNLSCSNLPSTFSRWHPHPMPVYSYGTERHSKRQEPKKGKVSGFKFSFYWRKEKKKEKNRLFFCLFVCFQVDVIRVVSLSQCPKATSLYTKYLQVHWWICLSLFLSLPSREEQLGTNLSPKGKKSNRKKKKKGWGQADLCKARAEFIYVTVSEMTYILLVGLFF